ncbi:MAG: glycosyltransferase family 9 protein, partial [Planctomycetota bacterium]
MTHSPRRIVAFVPNPVGDAVMFTPALRAIRAHFPEAELTLFARPGPAAVLTPNPWAGRILVDAGGLRSGARALRRGGFDLAVLGPNSFRSALLARLGGIGRRIGYRRDGRGWLLTDGVEPRRDAEGGLAVTPAVDFYLDLAAALGWEGRDRRMELAVGRDDRRRAEELLADADAGGVRPVVVLSP